MDDFSEAQQQDPAATTPPDSEEEHICRPLNAFMLYRIWRNAQRMKEYQRLGIKPDMQKNLSKNYADEWRALSKEAQDYWKRLAAEAKRRHKEMFPEYQYRPNKRKRQHEPSAVRKRVKKNAGPPGLPQANPVYPSLSVPQWQRPPGRSSTIPGLLAPSPTSSETLSPTSSLPSFSPTSHSSPGDMPLEVESSVQGVYLSGPAMSYAHDISNVANMGHHVSARAHAAGDSHMSRLHIVRPTPGSRFVPPSAAPHAGAVPPTYGQRYEGPVNGGPSISGQLQIRVATATYARESAPANNWNDIYAPLDAGFADFGAMSHNPRPTLDEQHPHVHHSQQQSHPSSTQAFNFPPSADYPFSFSLPPQSFSSSASGLSRNSYPQPQPFHFFPASAPHEYFVARPPAVAAPMQMAAADITTASTRLFTAGPNSHRATSSAPSSRAVEQVRPQYGSFTALGNAAGRPSHYQESAQGYIDITAELHARGPSSCALSDTNTSTVYAAEAAGATTFVSDEESGVTSHGNRCLTATDHASDSDIALWFEEFMRYPENGSQPVGMSESPLETLPESAVWPEEGSLKLPNVGP
ncbi:hypothetical protein GY45DRAFT_518397 [Cubamyces sp. BRFM 1775]|nr:hypothetical protein GY45DRAFT_518397 [Cubamyces sp. BRFM 1775]